MPEISILTVGMNHLPYLKNLLRSLYTDFTPETSFEMIYVDNCSTDGSADFVRKNYPQVHVIENASPQGFGHNNNLAAKVAAGRYLAINNPDIQFRENALDVLYRTAELLDGRCLLVPKLLNPDLSFQYSARGFITLSSLVNRVLTKGKDTSTNPVMRQYLFKHIEQDKIQPIDWAIGAAMFIDKELFWQLGGFDEDYFLYIEDTDLCVKAWKNEIPVIYQPFSQMVHNHMRASTKLSKKTWWHLQSYLTYFKKHGIALRLMHNGPAYDELRLRLNDLNTTFSEGPKQDLKEFGRF